MKFKVIIVLISFIFVGYGAYVYREEAIEKERVQVMEFVRQSISDRITKEGEFPRNILFRDESISVSYTLNEEFQNKLEKLLKRYPNEGCAVVVLDNESGKILALGSVERKNRKEIGFALPFSSTHPSASLFKIITMADLLKDEKLEPETQISYSGRSTTLYKYQLKNKINRWTRWVTLKRAFAQSNNVVFGKAAIQKTSARSIFQRAYAFGFNRQLMRDFNLGPSRFLFPETPYELAEVASGFNKQTLISPVHAALLSSIVANDGKLKTPFIVENVKFNEEILFYPRTEEKVIKPKVISDLFSMMELTAQKGTARALTRGRLGRKIKKSLIVGAKTGSITGGIPHGKREWLTLFAKKKGSNTSGISVGIMNIHQKKWYYKSSFLAKKILEIYLDNEEVAMKASKKPSEV
ncbi:MAG: penicillin-binding transpeptidase domain-containing protein [Halobacteriovoraceae bacterium]|nr:penicillin-binding transpeptidase domain-containing protein [Halobacteriovoraceae bacterium]